MKLTDDVPETIVRPYPLNPPLRNIGRPFDYPGRILAFEGPDGSGKSTQIKLLDDALRDLGYNCRVFSFVRNPLIQHAKAKGKWENWDPHTMALMFASSLTDLMNREVLPFIENDESVAIMDRYIPSVIARSEVRGCTRTWLNSILQQLDQPYFGIHMNIPTSLCLERKRNSSGTFSYWECGMDLLVDEDDARFEYIDSRYEEQFIIHQSLEQEIVNEILEPNCILQVASGLDSKMQIHEKIKQRILNGDILA